MREHLVDERKQREREYHDQLKSAAVQRIDPRWYVLGGRAYRWMEEWLRRHAVGKELLDFGCGSGSLAIKAAGMGARVTGVDISSRSIDVARMAARSAGVQVDFRVMDVEATEFADARFDIITCCGVLHHTDLRTSYRELGRLLRPDGRIIALEALGHNPLIRWYRRRTPNARTADEHPLLVPDLRLAREYFGDVDLRYFNLATLAAAPFYGTALLGPCLQILEHVDEVLLRVPGIQHHAWIVGMILARPRR